MTGLVPTFQYVECFRLDDDFKAFLIANRDKITNIHHNRGRFMVNFPTCIFYDREELKKLMDPENENKRGLATFIKSWTIDFAEVCAAITIVKTMSKEDKERDYSLMKYAINVVRYLSYI